MSKDRNTKDILTNKNHSTNANTSIIKIISTSHGVTFVYLHTTSIQNSRCDKKADFQLKMYHKAFGSQVPQNPLGS